MEEKPNKTITSKEAKRLLKVSDCELMHLRTSGKVKATKKGNSYLYDLPVDLVNKEKS